MIQSQMARKSPTMTPKEGPPEELCSSSWLENSVVEAGAHWRRN
jgi:hypothetical protein